MSVSQTLRFSVLERDGFKCRYCGTTAAHADLHVDHLVPVAVGGRDEIDNLMTACKDCNSGKGARLLKDEDSNVELRARLEQLMVRRDILKACVDVQDEILALKARSMWRIVEHWERYRGYKPDDDGTWHASFAICATIRSLLARLDFEEVLSCVDITLARQRDVGETHAIKYLYGVVRNREALVGDSE